MKKNLKMRVGLMFLSALFCLQGCSFQKAQVDDPIVTNAVTKPAEYHASQVYAYGTAVDESVLTTSKDAIYLLLANKEYALTEGYEPSNLTTLPNDIVTSWHTDLQLEERTAAALLYMLDEMKSAGVTDIKVTSAYRSYQRQKQLFQTYLEKECSQITADAIAYFGIEYIQAHYADGERGLSSADAKKVVLSYSAYPGTSEHQTGLCVDFITSSMGTSLTAEFENTDAFRWLSENAYRFGFILRYPKGKEAVTGYSYEPWHYRFVGREAATDIHFGKLTLEEYLSGHGIQA